MSTYSPEPWITRQELADQLHVSLRHVDHLVNAGAPSVVFGVRTRRFLASRVIAWAEENNREGEA